MNTPAHIIFGAAAFARAGRPGVTAAAFLGGLLPDLSLYLMVGVSIWGMGVPAQTVFREWYYSDLWQAVFAVDNSVLIWGTAFAIALWARREALVALCGAALLHLATDFPLHNHDARRHFWPLSDWVFVSPVSYWDRRHHAGIIEPLEVTVTLVLAALLVWRLKSPGFRALTLVLALAELGASGIWRFVF